MRSRNPLRRHLGLAAALTVMVLLLHGWVLAGLPLGVAVAQPRATTLQVREIRPMRPVPATEPPAATPAAAPPSPAPTGRQPRRAAASQRVDAPVPDPAPRSPADPAAAAEPPAKPVETAAAQVAEPAASAPVPPPDPDPARAESPSPDGAVTVAAAALVEVAVAPAPPPPQGAAVPVYRTRVPPAATLNFELRRGLLTGEGVLDWRPTPQGYELQFEGQAFGLALLGWASRGGFDAHGLAPLRYTDRRRGKALRAASFQRDKGLVSYSASTTEHALLPGAQDRLSWMLQLAAVVDAEPARWRPGERAVMQVVGARGDADLWALEVLGREALDLPAGRVEHTLRLRREPRKPFDTVVEVWLDPARHHLPVRLKLATAGGDDAMEFLLKP